MKSLSKIVLGLLLSLALVGCNMPGPTPLPTPTIDAALVSKIAALTLEAMRSPTPAVTITPQPSVTVTPTITPTYSTPMVEFTGNTNCRQGPGDGYDVVVVIKSGQKVEVVARPDKGSYWIVKSAKGECWVAGDYTKPSGSIDVLPTRMAPPTATPKPPAAPAWQTWNFSCEFATGGSTITVVMAWTDRANNEDGYIIYRNDEVVVNLAPEATNYTDVTFLASGQSFTYTIEAFNGAGRTRSTPINVTCQ